MIKITQTFWSAGQDPLKSGFGWSHAEYNLMSWALSCLSLREHYNDVELYTDSAGRHVLIDLLGLPYSKVHVVFDDFHCLPQHWALSKIKTYSMQTEPFLHVDGDIYVPRPLPADIMDAPLIVQNREIGTSYYRRVVDSGVLSHTSIKLPEFIQEEVKADSLPSFNMGFFGGSDLDFIHAYCDEVFRFMDTNRLNDPECPHNIANCNVFFEQIFFAVLADKARKSVTGVYGQEVRDNGYSTGCFCDLDNYTGHPFHHLLGGHKRNRAVMAAQLRALLRLYPEIYLRILKLFPGMNFRLADNSKEMEWALRGAYPKECGEDLKRMLEGWRNLEPQELLEWEKTAAECISAQHVNIPRPENLVRCNPWLFIYTLPEISDASGLSAVRQRLGRSQEFPLKKIVFAPQLRMFGYTEFAPSEIGEYILAFLSGGAKTVEDIEKHLKCLFQTNTEAGMYLIRKMTESELVSMQNRNIICLI